MKILFITHYYPPEIGAAANRIGYFARFLAKKGHEVSVLTCTPNYPEGKIYHGYENRYTVKAENGVTAYRTKIFLSTKKSTLPRLAHYLSFVISSLAAKRKIPKPDIILATSPPLFTGIIGAIFKKLWKIPLILDIRDIWPESVESVGAVHNKTLLKQGVRLARWIYKNADKITVTSPGIAKGIKNQEPSIKDIAILPNGAELDLFRSDIKSDNIQKKWGLSGKFVVLYTGNLGLAQAPEIILKTAEILKNTTDILFLIVGAGVLFETLQKQAQNKNLKNIIFTGPRPRAEMPQFVAASDICIIPYKASDTFRNTFPSKMFDYMAGGKPIIINLKGEASKLIEEAECGFCIEEENACALAQKITQLKENSVILERTGKNGRIFVEKNYTRETISNNLAQLILTQI